MPPVEVNKEFDLYGQFWSPSASDERIPGRLYRTSDDIRLQLFKDLRPGPSYVPRHQDGQATVYEVVPSPNVDSPITIHGSIGQLVGPITALECVTMRATSLVLGRGPAEYILAPLGIIFGGHTSGPHQRFTGVRIRTKDLDEWAGQPGFSATLSEDGAQSLNYKKASTTPIALANGAAVSLHQDFSMTSPPSFRGGSMRRRVWLQVTDLAPATWSEVNRQILTPLTSLISLCLGEVNHPTDVQLTIDGNEWVQFACKEFMAAEPSSRYEELATLHDLRMQGVATWLDKVEQLGPLPPVVATFAAKKQVTRLETELLEMTTVAEGLHARLFPDDRRLEESACEEIRSRVLDALSDLDDDGRAASILRGMLRHLSEPGYDRRLKGLAGYVADVAPQTCGNVSKWASEVSNARNSYAHRSAGFLGEHNIDALFTVLESLRWLLRCVLLKETGLHGSTLATKVAAASAYRLFLSRARENLPKIYNS